MIDLDLIENFSIDKSDWVTVKFGDIVYEPKESVKDPIAEGIEHVVGLEHIDSEDIHLRRSASIEESTTFTKRFRKGDVLFGRRRAYLKKAAKADFDGICSGDITVMRASEKILPELLPFIVNNDKFFDYAIEHSAGGLSPRVKFKDLAKYEFLLPSIDKQRKLLDFFEFADQLVLKDVYLKEKIEILRNTNREKLYTYGIKGLHNSNEISLTLSKCGLIRRDITVSRFFDCVEIASGQVDPSSEEYRDLYQIGSERIEANTGRIIELKSAKELGINSGNYLFTESDVIYSKIRPYFKKVANPNFTGLCSADIYPLRPKGEKLLKDFLFYYLLTEKFTRRLLRFQNRTGMPKVNRDELGSMYIPLPSTEEQQEIVDILNKTDDLYFKSEKKLNASKKLLNSTINQVF